MKEYNTPRLPTLDLSYPHKERLLKREEPSLTRRLVIVISSAAAIVLLITGSVLFSFEAPVQDQSTIAETTTITVQHPSPTTVDHTTQDTTATGAQTQIEITKTTKITREESSKLASSSIVKAESIAIDEQIVVHDSTLNTEAIYEKPLLSTINPTIMPVDIEIKAERISKSSPNHYAQTRKRMQSVTFLDGLKRSVAIQFNDFIADITENNPFKKESAKNLKQTEDQY